MRHWQNTSCRFYAFLRNYHSAIMQRRILKEYVFYQALVDTCIDKVASIHDIIERNSSLYYDKGTNFIFRHIHTCHHYRHNGFLIFFYIFSTLVCKQFKNTAHTLVGTEGIKEFANFFLK